MVKYTLFSISASALQPIFSLLNSTDIDTAILEFTKDKIVVKATPYYGVIVLLAEIRKRNQMVRDFLISPEKIVREKASSKIIIVNPRILYKYIERATDSHRQITFAYDDEQRKLSLTFYFRDKKFNAIIPTITTKPSSHQWLSEVYIEKPQKYIVVSKQEFVDVLTLFYSVKTAIVQIIHKHDVLEVIGFSDLDIVWTSLDILKENGMQFDKVQIRFETGFMKELYQFLNKLSTNEVYIAYKNNTIHLYCEGSLERIPTRTNIIISEAL